MDRGIMLAGGGSLLQGLDERLREETQMPAHLAESPLTCVAVGSGRSLEEFEAIHRSNRNSRQRRRSEEHTSELQSRRDLVCRLLLEKKNKQNKKRTLAPLPVITHEVYYPVD